MTLEWVSAQAIHGPLAYRTPDEYVFRKFFVPVSHRPIFIIPPQAKAPSQAQERGQALSLDLG